MHPLTLPGRLRPGRAPRITHIVQIPLFKILVLVDKRAAEGGFFRPAPETQDTRGGIFAIGIHRLGPRRSPGSVFEIVNRLFYLMVFLNECVPDIRRGRHRIFFIGRRRISFIGRRRISFSYRFLFSRHRIIDKRVSTRKRYNRGYYRLFYYRGRCLVIFFLLYRIYAHVIH